MSSSSSSNNNRKRKIALERFKNHRQERRSALEVDEEQDQDDDGQMFDIMSEKEYAAIVEARREREDFVVDDDGLGYYDDGEEHYGGEEDEQQQPNHKRRSSSSNNTTAALTAQALKKARQNLRAAGGGGPTGGGYGGGGDDDDDHGDGSKNANKTKRDGKIYSLWAPAMVVGPSKQDKGTTAKTRRGAATGSSRRGRASGSGSYDCRTTNSTIPNVDELLKELDRPEALPLSYRHHHRMTTSVSRGGSCRNYLPSHHPRPPPPTDYQRTAASSNSNHYDDANAEEEIEEYDDHQQPNDWPMNDEEENRCGNDPLRVGAEAITSPKSSPTSSTTIASNSGKRVQFATNLEQYKSLDEASGLASNGPTTNEEETEKSSEVRAGTIPEEQDANVPSSPPRPPQRRARKLGQLSTAAQRARQEEEEEEEHRRNNAKASSESACPSLTATGDESSTSLFVRPSPIAAEHTACGTVQALTLDDVVQSEAAPPKEDVELEQDDPEAIDKASKAAPSPPPPRYVDLFWMDIAEKNGDILLFGKVPHQNGFVSAMLWVTGHKRNLFVLPRPNVTMTDVHAEIHEVLHQRGGDCILPRVAGISWAGKAVKRNYAFADPTIPRQANTQYLKVVYDAKYPVPSERICTEGGKHFSRILGAGASNIENFIIKRKLKGPSWIRIIDPQPGTTVPISHAKVEFQVPSPKSIVHIDDVNRKPPPPMVTMSLKLKTVVNPVSHKSEVVSVSAICHRSVPLDSAMSDDLSPRHVTQLSLIRPLSNDPKLSARNFPDHFEREIKAHMPQLRTEINERALLSRLFLQIGQWDPDVIVGHNAWGYDLEVLLSRASELKIPFAWSKLGRRRRSGVVDKKYLTAMRDRCIADVIQGRLLCDTYLSAQELLMNETTYSLTNLAATCLKTNRIDVEPLDVPSWFESSAKLVQLAQTTLRDAELVQRLCFRLQVLPLTVQLTCIAGNLWSHTLRSNRAERTEYLLLHEFHQRKYIVPEKARPQGKKSSSSSSNKKAKYLGGLVLEPKRGFYDSFILLLDFNSLYPSLIQEYNLCFTTIEKWAEFAAVASGRGTAAAATDDGDEDDDDNNDHNHHSKSTAALPPLPDSSIEVGVLPKVIKSLVERRRVVKRLLKQASRPDKQAELDIRQKALKLTANSMYGCLGFSNSRFFAQPIAALVTAMGRETLQKTVDIAQNSIGLDVIYGDTDSIMINTRINDVKDVCKVTILGERVIKEVNKLYRTLELEVDAVFRSMLLLRKKKYAARTVEFGKDGTVVRYGQEMKGLDLVRRDWCIQSRETGRFVTEQILSGKDIETIASEIYNHLEDVSQKMRNGELLLEKFVITKGLSKHPKDYPDAKSLPHVQVAKMMIQNNRLVNTGDHIPYIITEPLLLGDSKEKERNIKKESSYADRARHPEEVLRSQGTLKPDVVWYLTQQILPPVTRLCETIEAISKKLIVEKLGLDASNVRDSPSGDGNPDEDEWQIEYKPVSLESDAERFKDVDKLQMHCMSCKTHQEFPGVVRVMGNDKSIISGLVCTNKNCPNPSLWGHQTHYECFGQLKNTMQIWVYKLLKQFYEGRLQCNEPSCQLVTRQVSVAGGGCLRYGCTGRLVPMAPTARDVHTHLKYLESLFHIQHTQEQLLMHHAAFQPSAQLLDTTTATTHKRFDLAKELATHDKTVFRELHKEALHILKANDYNWISPSFWNGLFQKAVSNSKQ